ncbi:unnamed protein product [Strongylus vulgaris]|uniref:Uncharacterized protein n=1 Tax=Strongylus vulgaris TaxID=40348 RepID=A0A3P7K5B1_STRVU|nr:unnamed protein product [Strongylus vulgaris]
MADSDNAPRRRSWRLRCASHAAGVLPVARARPRRAIEFRVFYVQQSRVLSIFTSDQLVEAIVLPQCYAVGNNRMILLRLQQLILLVFVTYTIALATVWSKVSRVFKITRKSESNLDSDALGLLSDNTKTNRNIFRAIASSAQNMLSGRSSYDYHLALEDDVNDMKELGMSHSRISHFLKQSRCLSCYHFKQVFVSSRVQKFQEILHSSRVPL